MSLRRFSSWMCTGLLLLGVSGLTAADFPDPALDNKTQRGKQTAVLAGGCFWCTEVVFQQIEGVEKVVSGYSGGDAASAHYDMVSTGTTGHAEVVEVTFNPQKISYGQLLKVFFDIAHDPTQLNRQGPDSGTQYRSAIFYADEKQKEIATAYIAQLDKAGKFARPIVTRVDSLQGFFAAEDYHQDYLLKHPRDPYIVFNDQPKVRNFQRTLPELYRAEPVTVGQRSTTLAR